MIIKKNLSEQIYEELKTDILTQKLGFGEKLINRDLQKRFGVSSTPVRDAVNRLYLDGLLEDISNGGARVISFDVNMALEINEIVALISRDAVELAIKKNNQEALIRDWEGILEKQLLNIAGQEYLVYDKQFHRTFFNYCGNSKLVNIYDELNVLWDMLIQMYHKNSHTTRKKAFIQHQEILNACKKGDFALVNHLVFEHVIYAAGPLKEQLTK